mgnify:FL=1
MKYLVHAIFIISLVASSLKGQTRKLDSLKKVLQTSKSDTNKVILLNRIGKAMWSRGEYNQGLSYSAGAIELAGKLKFMSGQAYGHVIAGLNSNGQEKPVIALEHLFKAEKIFERIQHLKGLSSTYNNLAMVYG